MKKQKLLLLLLTLKVPLWWTLFKPFINIILTHVTKGLRILCLWLSILGGADVSFTQEPSNPSYFKNGSDAKLVWDYTDPLNATRGIIFSVLVKDTYKKLFSGAVVVSKNIVIFLHLIKEELKLKEELPCLSRTSTLETIPNLNVKCGERKLKV